MKLIALDLGSHMALAHSGFEDVTVCEAKLFDGIRSHRAGRILVWLEGRLQEILKHCEIDAIVYERPFARGFDATRAGWGIAGIIEALATKYNLGVVDTTPQQIKSFALGGVKRPVHFATVDGKRQRVKATSAERHAAAAQEKLAMTAAARARGYQGDNEHEADAFLLLQFALAHAKITPSKGTPNVERTGPSKRRRTGRVAAAG